MSSSERRSNKFGGHLRQVRRVGAREAQQHTAAMLGLFRAAHAQQHETEQAPSGEGRPGAMPAAVAKALLLRRAQLLAARKAFGVVVSEKEKRAAAAILVQCIYRGYVERKAHAAEYHKINLKFEISILEERCRRRGLFVGFLQRARRPPPIK